MNVVEMEKNDLGRAMDVIECGDCEVKGKREREKRRKERVKDECGSSVTKGVSSRKYVMFKKEEFLFIYWS